MPTFEITDPTSGKVLEITGDTPPTEVELEEIFAGINASNEVVEETTEESIPLVQGVAESMGQGATFGFSDEIQSVIAAAVAAPFVSDRTFGELMKDARANIRKDQEQFSEERPNTALASEVAGGFLTGGGLAKGAAKAGTKALAKQGAAFGATAGAGFSDSDEFLSSETLEDALTGSTLGAAFGTAAPKVMKAISSAGSKIPQRLPEKMMESVLKIRPSIDQAARKRMIRTALDENILPSVKGLDKITKNLNKLNTTIDNIIDTATNNGTEIPAAQLFKQLRPLREKVGGAKLDAAGDLDVVNKVAREFGKQLKKLGKTKLTPREVQELKTDAYKRINFDLQQGNANFAKNEAKRAIAREAKEQIEKLSPEVKPTNEKIGRFLELQDELERSVSRLENNNVLSLDSAAKVAAGAAAGSTTAGTAVAISGQPTIKARMALAIENLRKSGEAKKLAQETLPPELMKIMSNIIGDTEIPMQAILEQIQKDDEQ